MVNLDLQWFPVPVPGAWYVSGVSTTPMNATAVESYAVQASGMLVIKRAACSRYTKGTSRLTESTYNLRSMRGSWSHGEQYRIITATTLTIEII